MGKNFSSRIHIIDEHEGQKRKAATGSKTDKKVQTAKNDNQVLKTKLNCELVEHEILFAVRQWMRIRKPRVDKWPDGLEAETYRKLAKWIDEQKMELIK